MIWGKGSVLPTDILDNPSKMEKEMRPLKLASRMSFLNEVLEVKDWFYGLFNKWDRGMVE
jgi:hypothetical protein